MVLGPTLATPDYGWVVEKTLRLKGQGTGSKTRESGISESKRVSRMEQLIGRI